MRNFNNSAAVNARIAEEALSLVYVLLIQLRTGEQFFYTEGSNSVTVEGILYRSDPGLNVTAIRDSDSSASQTATVELGYADDMITEELVRKGGLDKATFNLGLTDYRDRAIPFIELFSGRIDRVTAANPYTCSIDLTGWQQKSVNLPGVYSLKCRNVFCDRGCTLNIEDYKHPFTMLGDSTDSMTFRADVSVEEGALSYGSCKWLTGRNAGVKIGIAYNAEDQVKLMAPTPYIPQAGDTGILTEGCDFYADTCEERFDNLINMKAEPAVPQGTEQGIEAAAPTETKDPYKPDPAPQPVYSAESNNMPMG